MTTHCLSTYCFRKGKATRHSHICLSRADDRDNWQRAGRRCVVFLCVQFLVFFFIPAFAFDDVDVNETTRTQQPGVFGIDLSGHRSTRRVGGRWSEWNHNILRLLDPLHLSVSLFGHYSIDTDELISLIVFGFLVLVQLLFQHTHTHTHTHAPNP